MSTFKTCTGCGHEWESRAAFIGDPEVSIIGYQVNFELLQAGFFLFNHCLPHCRSTLSVPAGLFFDLHEGAIFERRTTEHKSCPRYCLREEDLRPCPTTCECAFVREILQVIRRWPKRVAG